MWPELYDYEQMLREEVLHFLIENEERQGESLYTFVEDDRYDEINRRV